LLLQRDEDLGKHITLATALNRGGGAVVTIGEDPGVLDATVA
jgi:hypothetical protein